MFTFFLLVVVALLFAGLLIQRLEILRIGAELEILQAGRQAVANLEERVEDARALEAEKRQLVQIAADQGERIRVLEVALRDVLPTLRKTAREFRLGSGEPIACAEWGAVATVEAALGIESED